MEEVILDSFLFETKHTLELDYLESFKKVFVYHL